jgi:hypothetical protein
VLLHRKKVIIKGREEELYIVEISRTKHKVYITAVNMKDPHEHYVIEEFRKVFQRGLDSLSSSTEERLSHIVT